MDILFIADVFADEIPGGGELVNDLVISGLREKGHNIITIKSQDLDIQELLHYSCNGYHIILANHLGMTFEQKNLIRDLSDKQPGFKYLI